MEINNQPFTPSFEKHGTMTIFALEGALGFAGGGAFQGQAELQRLPGEPMDPVSNQNWDWVFDDMDYIREKSEEMEYIEEDSRVVCPLQHWPRWSGQYHPPNSPVMTLYLMATGYDEMIGQAYYSGVQNGADVFIDSRFLIKNQSVDSSDFDREVFPDDSPECQAECSDNNLCID